MIKPVEIVDDVIAEFATRQMAAFPLSLKAVRCMA